MIVAQMRKMPATVPPTMAPMFVDEDFAASAGGDAVDEARGFVFVGKGEDKDVTMEKEVVCEPVLEVVLAGVVDGVELERVKSGTGNKVWISFLKSQPMNSKDEAGPLIRTCAPQRMSVLVLLPIPISRVSSSIGRIQSVETYQVVVPMSVRLIISVLPHPLVHECLSTQYPTYLHVLVVGQKFHSSFAVSELHPWPVGAGKGRSGSPS